MGVIMGMLLDFKHLVGGLKLLAYLHVKRLGIFRERCVISILHIFTFPRLISLHVHHLLNKIRIKVREEEETTGQINHRTYIAVLVNQMERRNVVLLRHPKVISTKCTSDMHNTSTILSGHIITGNDTKCTFSGIDPRKKLLVVDTYKVKTIDLSHYFVWNQFVTLVVGIKRKVFSLRIEQRPHEGISSNHSNRLAGIWIVGTDDVIKNLRSNSKSRVRWKCPRSGGPSKKIRSTPLEEEVTVGSKRWIVIINHTELGYASGVLHIAIASRLIELMRTQSGSCRRRIWLNCVTFVKIPFLIELAKKPPYAFNVPVIISNVCIRHINPIAHLTSEILPFASILHNLTTARGIILVNRDLFTDVLLCYAKVFLNPEFHRQAMSVPAGFTLHLKALHGLVTAENIFYRTRQHMMYSRLAIC